MWLSFFKTINLIFTLFSHAFKIIIIALDSSYKYINFIREDLNTTDNYTYIDNEQYNWYLNTISRYPNYRIIILSHHVISNNLNKNFYNEKLFNQITLPLESKK